MASAIAPSFSRVSDLSRTETVLLAIEYSPVFSCVAFYPEMQRRTMQNGVVCQMWLGMARTYHGPSREKHHIRSTTSPLLVGPMRRQTSRGCRQGKLAQHSDGTAQGSGGRRWLRNRGGQL